MTRTVRVRVAVAVDAGGLWAAVPHWDGELPQDALEELADSLNLDEPRRFSVIEASVEPYVDPDVEVVEGEVVG